MASSDARVATMTAREWWSTVGSGAVARSEAQAREAAVRLDSDQVWTRRVQRGSDLHVTCLRGLVWMTREGDHRDHFLRAGETNTTRGPGLVCVQATAPSQLLVITQ